VQMAHPWGPPRPPSVPGRAIRVLVLLYFAGAPLGATRPLLFAAPPPPVYLQTLGVATIYGACSARWPALPSGPELALPTGVAALRCGLGDHAGLLAKWMAGPKRVLRAAARPSGDYEAEYESVEGECDADRRALAEKALRRRAKSKATPLSQVREPALPTRRPTPARLARTGDFCVPASQPSTRSPLSRWAGVVPEAAASAHARAAKARARDHPPPRRACALAQPMVDQRSSARCGGVTPRRALPQDAAGALSGRPRCAFVRSSFVRSARDPPPAPMRNK
jgi:hypothetical protein